MKFQRSKKSAFAFFSAALPFLVSSTALATLPIPVYPQCGSEPDMDDAYCPSDFNEDWRFLSYVKDEEKAHIRLEEWAMGSGFWLDKAFSLETGDFQVTIAVLDSGIKWDSSDLLNKHRLNPLELPLPQDSNGQIAESYDFNQDGIFNIRDYAEDPRVDITAGTDAADSVLDPSDLIATFSDGIDQDANGYVDDISGWDFFWDDNNPYDTVRYGHGTGEAEDSAREGDNGGGIGTCPNCAVLNLRVGDSFVTDVNCFAEAVIYAADNNAQVIQEALGTMNNSTYAMDALDYAYSKGLTVVASAADETSIHQNQPANNEGTLVVKAIRYDADDEADASTYLAFENCTNFGGHVDLSVSGTSCSSEATGRAAGLVGLLYSAALHEGLELSPNEIRQLLTTTADDIDVPETYDDGVKKWYPSQPGWDRYFAYGRVNIYRALQKVFDADIPPEAELTEPGWFQVLDPERTPIIELEGRIAAARSPSFSYVIEYGVGLDPLDEEFVILDEGSSNGPMEGPLTTFDLRNIPTELLDPIAWIEPLAMDDTVLDRHEKVNRYTITVRIRVSDASGRLGEARRTLYVKHDPDLLDAFPLYVAGSMEASPQFYDLNGDGKDELVQATADGVVMALQADGSELEGWPVYAGLLKSLDPDNPDNHLAAEAFMSGAVSSARHQAIISAPAVGDLDRDGQAEVIAGTYDGEVYVWHADGSLAAGFPVSVDPIKATDENTSKDNYLEGGFFSAPSLGDLDFDGRLEIIIGAMDQWVYAWEHDGSPSPGWPVHAIYPFETENEVHLDRIMTSPAIGDINRDGRTEVIIGTNEIIDDVMSPTYAIKCDGNLSLEPFVDGWPVLTRGLFADILPTVGKGTTSSPVLADLDNDGFLEIAAHTVTGAPSPQYPSIFKHNGRPYSVLKSARRSWGPLTNTDEPAAFVVISTGAFGDIDQDGDIDYTLSLGGFNAFVNLMASATRIEHNYLVGAWDATSGSSLDGFPQQVADMQFFINQAIADLNGDGLPEVISGNGSFTVDAFDRDGAQPEGWPRFTGQWNVASPAVGDMDGDGLLEIVQSTRSGWIYVWNTTGSTPENGGVVEWASYHHDAANTGNYEANLDGSLTRRLPPDPGLL